MRLRSPSVAGTFYPKGAAPLRAEVLACLGRRPKTPALAVIVPHAGYRYSGPVAGAAYGSVDVPQDVVILAFHHRGRGARMAVWPDGSWTTPLGEVPVNGELARRIVAGCPGAEFDEEGFLDEHSAEVQVPFLQVARPDVRIAAVSLSVWLDEADALEGFGRALAGVLRDELVVGSTDLNHEDDHATTLEKDGHVIRAMERLDGAGVARAIVEHDVKMCGFAPTIATLAYARARGAVRGEVVEHRTSADASGDYDRCVGYLGMKICGS